VTAVGQPAMQNELGLDRRETGLLYPIDELDIVTVIKVSTRGTFCSDTWLMQFVETNSVVMLPSVVL